MEKTQIYLDYDNIIVQSPILELKLDTNRIIYSKSKYAEDHSFKRINELPKEIKKASAKRVFLYQLHQTIQDRIINNPKNKVDLKQDSEDSAEEETEKSEEENVEDNDDLTSA